MLLGARMSASRRRSGGGGGGVTSTKWRIVINETWALSVHGDQNVSASEIEMRATPGGADQCAGGVAMASSEYSSSYQAAYAFANDADSTFWASGGNYPQWIEYDFSAPVSVEEIAYLPRTGLSYQSPIRADIEYWDGTSWQLAWKTFDVSGWSDLTWKNFTTPIANARWRVYVASASGSGVLGFREIEMRATSGGANQCTGGRADSISQFDINYIPTNAFDGTTNEWATANGEAYAGSWCGYDFLTSKDIVEIAITARGGADGLSGGATFNFQKYNISTMTWDTVWSAVSPGFSGGETKVFTKP